MPRTQKCVDRYHPLKIRKRPVCSRRFIASRAVRDRSSFRTTQKSKKSYFLEKSDFSVVWGSEWDVMDRYGPQNWPVWGRDL